MTQGTVSTTEHTSARVTARHVGGTELSPAALLLCVYFSLKDGYVLGARSQGGIQMSTLMDNLILFLKAG